LKDCETTGKEVEGAANAFKDKVQKSVVENELFKSITAIIDWDEIFDLAVTALVRQSWTTLATTGIVFAGFGENQYFPHLHHFTCYGIVLGKLLCSRDDENNVSTSHQNISEIIPLAQSEMVNTFIYGASISAIGEIEKNFSTAIDDYTSKLAQAGSLSAPNPAEPNAIEAHKEHARTVFQDLTAQYLSKEHMIPLRNVVGMLSIDELASLAETLIAIESLKERVTRPPRAFRKVSRRQKSLGPPDSDRRC
jgi:hypothetical protein